MCYDTGVIVRCWVALCPPVLGSLVLTCHLLGGKRWLLVKIQSAPLWPRGSFNGKIYLMERARWGPTIKVRESGSSVPLYWCPELATFLDPVYWADRFTKTRSLWDPQPSDPTCPSGEP